jgi:hypothetical protein
MAERRKAPCSKDFREIGGRPNRLRRRTAKEVRQRSDFLRSSLFFGLALRNDGGAKTSAEVVREFVKLGVAIDLDGFLGGIADHVAVVAPRQVILEFRFGTVVEDIV